MAGPAILKLQIIADATKAIGAVNGMGKAVDASGKQLDSGKRSLGDYAKTAAKVAGAAALGGLVAVFKTGISEQSDFLAGQAQLANGIKTTGNAAHVSVNGLESLASSIQNYSGQTDDSIVASEKLLLTFTNIGNRTGKNNDIFNQATKMTADMAAKMGGDASTYAVQLGKALNDPVKGITALTRVGVSFTAQQKKTISSMQESGNVIGAQKVIMGELRKEFGGSAKAAGQTLPGQMARAKRAFEDVSQGVIAGLMPILTQLANFLLKTVMPAFAKVVGFISQHQTVFGILAGAILLIVGAVKAWAFAQAILNAELFANPIGVVILAVLALGAALIYAYKKSATFRAIVQTTFNVVKTAVKALFLVWKVQFLAIVAIVKGLVTAFRVSFNTVLSIVRSVGNAVATAVRTVVRSVSGIIHTIVEVITTPFRNAWDAALNVIHNFIPRITGAVSNMIDAIGRFFGRIVNAMSQPFRDGFDAIKSVINSIKSWISSAVEGIKNTFSSIVGAFRNVWNSFASFWNGIQLTIPKIKLRFLPDIPGFTIGLPDLPMLASGGYVKRATAAVIGEGGPEIVAPDAILRSILRDEIGRQASNITINIPPTANPAETGRAVVKAIRAYERASGASWRGA
jgi:Prophage tail length tape measure protein